MSKLVRYLIILGVVSTLSACTFGPIKKRGGDKAAETDTTMEQKAPDTSTETVTEESFDKFVAGDTLDVSSLSDPDSPLSQRVLYFSLDSSQVSESDRDILTVHADFLAAHPEISVVLEGHADERGTREYNIALGEKRAKAVMQLMTLQGVTERQIQVISFGEERPVALGHDSSAWNLNRRVEILYTGY